MVGSTHLEIPRHKSNLDLRNSFPYRMQDNCSAKCSEEELVVLKSSLACFCCFCNLSQSQLGKRTFLVLTPALLSSKCRLLKYLQQLIFCKLDKKVANLFPCDTITRRRTVDGKDFEGHSISRCSVNPSVSPPDWVAPCQAIRGCLLHLKFWKRVEKEGFERVLNEGRVRLFRRLVEAWQIGADGAVFLERARNLINRSKQQPALLRIRAQ